MSTLDSTAAAWQRLDSVAALEEQHATARLFSAAGFDLTPLLRVMEGDGYRPFDGRDLDALDAFFGVLAEYAGEDAVTASLSDAEFSQDVDVLLFSVLEALPFLLLNAVGHEAAAGIPEPSRRLLIAGVAENPDGAFDVLRAIVADGVSENALAAIFHRAHSQVTGWRLYFIARALLYLGEQRVSEIAARVATTEPTVFETNELVIRTANDAIRKGTLLIEKDGRMPNAVLRGAWEGHVELGELLAGALARVLEHRTFVGSDRPDQIGRRLWRCRR